MKYLIGIDLGTSAVKAARFDTDGNILDAGAAEYPLYQPQNGYAEQNPDDWWNAVKPLLDGIIDKAGAQNIAGIGLSGQMHGLVTLDESGKVIRPAILWCDQRTGAQCEQITQRIGAERLIELTANPALPGFTASKILWLRQHEPENYAKCRHILLPKDYIRYKLTGVFASDVSDASGMQLLDVKKRIWSEEVLEKLGIDRALLPELYESCEITGYYRGIPVAAGGGDNACAAVGCGVVSERTAFTTIGTSGVVYAHTDRPVIDKKGRIHTFCCAVPGAWHVMGVTQAAGLSLKWFKSLFAAELSYAELDRLCEEIPIGAEKLVYLPYLMGERTPILDDSARGVFFGLSAMHTRAHMARAVMEGVSYSLKDCLDVLNEVGVNFEKMAVCGGGAKGTFWRGMIADVFGMPVTLMHSEESAVLGAAIRAGTASGVFTDVREGCGRMTKTAGSQPCNLENHAKYEKVYRVYRALYPALRKNFRELAVLS